MYDPARDVFTNSDDAPVENNGQTSPKSPLGIKRKRSHSTAPPPQSQVSESPSSPMAQKNGRLSEPDKMPTAKRVRSSPTGYTEKNVAPVPMTAANLSAMPRSKKSANEPRKRALPRRQRSPVDRKRSRSPARQASDSSRRERRRSPRRKTASPKPVIQSPTLPPRSPPRQRKRPGAGARVSVADQEAVKRRQLERDQAQKKEAQAEVVARGVQDIVKQHYNQAPQRGIGWRKTESLISGLRSFNNWVKSATIQKFSPNDDYTPGPRENGVRGSDQVERGLLVLDIGCGKGGDLQKWQAAPQKVDLYVGLDPADVSIEQARGRYLDMQKRVRRDRQQHNFQAEFLIKDCFGEWLGDLPIVQEVGIDGSVGPNAHGSTRPGGKGGFDVVSMMFCMHYAFESEAKAKMMLRNVAGALKKGGRFLGVIPNSDVLTAKVKEYNLQRGKTVTEAYDDDWDPEKPSASKIPSSPGTQSEAAECGENGDDDWNPEEPSTASVSKPKDAIQSQSKIGDLGNIGEQGSLEWGNSIYRVKFPGKVPEDGIFRPPFGWKYFYFLEEAVEEVPEYVVPWEAFRAMAVDYDLELQYRKPFNEVWDAEKDDPVLGPLSERMNVREKDRGPLKVREEEFEAAGLWHLLCRVHPKRSC